jgi:hypothetical protein
MFVGTTVIAAAQKLVLDVAESFWLHGPFTTSLGVGSRNDAWACGSVISGLGRGPTRTACTSETVAVFKEAGFMAFHPFHALSFPWLLWIEWVQGILLQRLGHR